MTDKEKLEMDSDLEQAIASESDQLPEENMTTETGVHNVPESNTSGKRQRDRLEEYTSTSPSLTGGDVDAAWEQADAVGDEAVGGSAPTPDQNVTEELESAVGLEIDDRSFLRTNEILEQRDDRRWELEPKSAEDYQERRE